MCREFGNFAIGDRYPRVTGSLRAGLACYARIRHASDNDRHNQIGEANVVQGDARAMLHEVSPGISLAHRNNVCSIFLVMNKLSLDSTIYSAAEGQLIKRVMETICVDRRLTAIDFDNDVTDINGQQQAKRLLRYSD